MTNFTATERRSHLLAAVGQGPAYSVKNLCSTVEVAAVTTQGRTINFGYIPSNARILGSSRLYWDDLSNAGSPTLDLGIGAVNGNLANADDPDGLSDGHALSTATNDALAITLVADYGLPAWDYVASETSDPGGVLMVYGTVLDAATTVAGTVTLDLYYALD